MEIWQIAGIVLAVVLFTCIIIFCVVKKIIDKVFKRVERPNYSSLVQFKDVKREYPAELIKFRSGENMLQGYLLGAENTKGLVVVVHGLGGGAEGYLNEILYFVKHGYRVFAYDNTGYHLSEGKNCVGLPQAVEDLDAALTFIENESRLSGLPVYLFGHSWGGYSVCAVLNFNHKVNAVVSVSGFSNPKKMIFEWGKRMVGIFAYVFAPFMYLYQQLKFGDKLKITAVAGINKADIPVLLVHGSKDPTVKLEGAATISCKEEITNPKVQYLLWEKEGQNGHLDVLYEVAAREYGFQISEQYRDLLKKTKNQLTEEDKAEFFANVDKTKSSVSNEELMGQIAEFFEQA